MKGLHWAAILIIGLLLVFVAVAVATTNEEEASEEVEVYFRDQIWQKAVSNNDGMMPIEGFDPDLYMGAYPNLTKEDFADTAAIGGKWELQNGELIFIRNDSGEITSADGTLNEEGLEQLLENLEERLDRNIKTKQDVDSLLIELSSEEVVECSEESRNAEVCTAIYNPVCGYFGENIQCITAPCAQTYPSECQACMDKNVKYWTRGECPVFHNFNSGNETDADTETASGY